MALVITRRPGEGFLIGDDITIDVVKINGNQVQIAINAPKDIHIERDDIKNRKPKKVGE